MGDVSNTGHREWALYLGRPQFLKVEDIDAKRPGEGCENPSLDIRMSAAWTNLLDIVGRICDVLWVAPEFLPLFNPYSTLIPILWNPV